jgi:enoyl-[acyl-carrier-protein] reductase (NADH)
MAAIMADATNSGVERMAESSRGVTLHQMMLMIERHIRPETYAVMMAAARATPLKRAIEAHDVAKAVMACITHLTHTTGSIVSVDAGRHL